ncbi:hypothetical protein DM806_11135 [Sphingobium lactosutens]|uniref:YciI family protein n=1 Tax=Sphingobium lactosutens TaxID=522773 RepID=UPI0015B8B16C|nr:YciI family protein [Sphingobium lactosutens]NWK96209.1 hypothetical protein [Sphingobium lactosutens]
MKLFGVIYTMLDIELSNMKRPEHIAFLQRLREQGRIETGWKFPHYERGAIQGTIICRGESSQEVASWFMEDPVVLAGARTFEVREALPMSI